MLSLILTSRREYAQAMRAGLLALGEEGTQVDVEFDALRAMELASRRYELVVIDRTLNFMDGLQLLSLFKQRAPDSKFVVISEPGDETSRAEAYRNGADLFLERSAGSEGVQTILEAMRTFLEAQADSPKEAGSGTDGEETALLPGETALPPLNAHWRVDLTGQLVEGSQVSESDRCAFITYFFYRKLADIAVALDVDYFNHMTLWGSHLQQVLVADNLGIRHAVFDTPRTDEKQREQYVKWCCEQNF